MNNNNTIDYNITVETYSYVNDTKTISIESVKTTSI